MIFEERSCSDHSTPSPRPSGDLAADAGALQDWLGDGPADWRGGGGGGGEDATAVGAARRSSHDAALQLEAPSVATGDPSRRRSTGDALGAGPAGRAPHDAGLQLLDNPSPSASANPSPRETALALPAWVASHLAQNGGGPLDAAARRRYFERAVRVLAALAEGLESGRVPPSGIAARNVIVREGTSMGGEELTADFVECRGATLGDDAGDVRMKYAAMDALGRIAYEMLVLGNGPSIAQFRSERRSSLMDASLRDGSVDTTTTLEEDLADIMEMLRKNARMTTSEEDGSGVVSAMLGASVPFPLCRLVRDLLDDGNDGTGRPEQSFASWADVLADLRQMSEHPDAFLHASSPDRWKLQFGEKLYGRDDATKAILDAAERVATVLDDDPLLFDWLPSLTGETREVVFVKGHSGSGKSRLVRLAGTALVGRGWRFLQCKFDRVARPEPLSVLASAFDDYFISFMSGGGSACDDLPDMRQSLGQVVGAEGLGELARFVPSLSLVMGAAVPVSAGEVTETELHILFGKLIEALSSKQAPTMFFCDDLQWADDLSLSMLYSLVKGARPDLMHLASSESESEQSSVGSLAEQENNVLFVGSYRDKEVGDDHSLAKVLKRFGADNSISTTDICLTGIGVETLTEMLSDTLCIPARRVRSLAELVLHKTTGHIQFIQEFIQALAADNLLTHSFARGWEWDEDSIDIFPITSSVAELFALKLQRLPQDILFGLQILSVFGSQIDRNVLRFVGDYDGEPSVDLRSAIDLATSEGLLEKAGESVRFAHDVIQEATIKSIAEDALIPMLQMLANSLIRNATSAGGMDSVLFVIVDLVNRIGRDASPQQCEFNAELNLRAATKAASVPDFAGAGRYAESGISFLSDDCWSGSQYDVTLGLFETAALSHFSCMGGDRDLLQQRIDAVFEHAKTFDDKFKTHCVWIQLLSITDLSKAIEECLSALSRLQYPLDLSNVGFSEVCSELTACKDKYSGQSKQELVPATSLDDPDLVRALKILVYLFCFHHRQKSFLTAFVARHMVEITLRHGTCGDSAFGVAAFATALINILDDVEEGDEWGRLAKSLMRQHSETDIPMPTVTAALYGIVFIWKEPLQSTLLPLAQGVRVALETGNVEFAVINSGYYTVRSWNVGKCLGVLRGEIEALARQFRTHYDSSSNDSKVYRAVLQFLFTPLYNTVLRLEGREDRKEGEEPAFPWADVQIRDNDEILKASLDLKQFVYFHTILTYQTSAAFLSRDMESALRYANVYYQHFASVEQRIKFSEIFNILWEGLITLHFARRTGEEQYRVRGKHALEKVNGWSAHSSWNFQNKRLLLAAEWHYTMKDYDEAALCYEGSIKAAAKHRFVHEEAIAAELAGHFFLERGLLPKAHQFFLHSAHCFKTWGGLAVAHRVEAIVKEKFNWDLMNVCPVDGASVASFSTEKPPSPAAKKRRQSGSLTADTGSLTADTGSVILSPGQNGAINEWVLEGKSFLLAGAFVEVDSDRTAAERVVINMIKSFGGKVVIRFSKSTDYMLAGKFTNAAKINAARKRYPPVDVVSLERLQRLLLGELTFEGMRALPPLTVESFKDKSYQPARRIG